MIQAEVEVVTSDNVARWAVFLAAAEQTGHIGFEYDFANRKLALTMDEEGRAMLAEIGVEVTLLGDDSGSADVHVPAAAFDRMEKVLSQRHT